MEAATTRPHKRGGTHRNGLTTIASRRPERRIHSYHRGLGGVHFELQLHLMERLACEESPSELHRACSVTLRRRRQARSSTDRLRWILSALVLCLVGVVFAPVLWLLSALVLVLAVGGLLCGSRIRVEELVIVEGVGVTITARSLFGVKSHVYADWRTVANVCVAETIQWHRVLFTLVLLLDGDQFGEQRRHSYSPNEPNASIGSGFGDAPIGCGPGQHCRSASYPIGDDEPVCKNALSSQPRYTVPLFQAFQPRLDALQAIRRFLADARLADPAADRRSGSVSTHPINSCR